MNSFRIIIFLTFLTCCKNRQTTNFVIETNHNLDSTTNIVVSAIDAKFPLQLSNINLQDKNNESKLNENIIAKINEIVKDYAKDNVYADGDSLLSYKDSYINTIRLQDSLQTIFVVLLKHYPTGVINSTILFYDNSKKEFADKSFDFNLWVLYNLENGFLKPTELKQNLKINTPEIELVDYDKDGISDYKFVRLWHNGSFNALYTTVIKVKDKKIDTLFFNDEPIGNEQFRSGIK